jgi:transcriptional regulator with XRE-family HTH domain
MTIQEFAALREQLEISDEELATKLGVTPRLIQKWRDGRVAIGERFALALQSLAFRKRADALLATSGLPVCSVITDANARASAGAVLSTNDILNLNRHVHSCATCQARERYVAQRLGPAPAPAPADSVTGRIYVWVALRIGLLPEWARPAAGGAIILFAFVAGRVIFALPSVLFRRGALVGQWWLPMLVAPFAAALGGAVGGFGYSFLGKPLRQIRVVGGYLAGVVTVTSYMIALSLIAWLMGVPIVTSESDAFLFAGGTIFFGLLVGKSWFKADDASRARGPATSVATGT